MNSNKLILQEKDCIGKGCHKLTYILPTDPKKCIKVIYNDDGLIDIHRELKYREYRVRKGLTSTIIPEYYGIVETNLGTGYIFDYICDFDGSISTTLMDYVHNEILLIRDYDKIIILLKELKKHLWEDKIISMNITPENIVFQKTDAENLKLYLITDLGVGEVLPLVLYSDSLAYKKIQRRWDKFISLLDHEWGTSSTLSKLTEALK